MDVKIYADTTTGFLHFDGSRISPKPLNGGTEVTSGHLELELQEVTLLPPTWNPRVMFKHLKMNRVAGQDGTNLYFSSWIYQTTNH